MVSLEKCNFAPSKIIKSTVQSSIVNGKWPNRELTWVLLLVIDDVFLHEGAKRIQNNGGFGLFLLVCREKNVTLQLDR